MEPIIMVKLRSMRENLIFFLVIVAMMVGYYVYMRPQLRPPRGVSHPAIGEKLTYLELQPLDEAGPTLELADLAGKVTLVNFWATWCGPCVQEFPHLMKIKDEFSSHPNFEFVSISCPGGGETRDDVRAASEQFLAARDADVRPYFDPNQSTYKMVNNTTNARGGIPMTLVLDGEGTIRGFWEGYFPGVETEINDLLQELLKSN
jgi:thiol-disulfide isomerase/thioredoxin